MNITHSYRRRRTLGRVMAAVITLVVACIAIFAMSSSAAPETSSRTASDHSQKHDAKPLPGYVSPVMGYDNWDLNHCKSNQHDVLSAAHALVSSGLAAAGYKTVIVDDCWMAKRRTASGQLTWDTATFPRGIPWLAARIHAMGLKFGLYEDVGLRTCSLRPGDLGHYSTDAKTFKSWHVNLVKIDMCQFPPNTNFMQVIADYNKFGKDLAAEGIAFDDEAAVKALIDFGDPSPEYTRAIRASTAIAAMSRVTPDEGRSAHNALIDQQDEHNTALAAQLTHLTSPFADIVLRAFAVDLPLASYASAGHWNDLDMLVPGNPNYGFTEAQSVAQISIWAELASPLVVSTDLTTLSPALLRDLKNPAMIAIDQSGEQAREIAAKGPVVAVGKPDPQGGTALLLVNMSSKPSMFDMPVTKLGLLPQSLNATNIWSGATRTLTGSFRYEVPADDSCLLRVSTPPNLGSVNMRSR